MVWYVTVIYMLSEGSEHLFFMFHTSISAQYISIAWGRLSVCFWVNGVRGREPVTLIYGIGRKKTTHHYFGGLSPPTPPTRNTQIVCPRLMSAYSMLQGNDLWHLKTR